MWFVWLVNSIVLILVILGSVALFTGVERKVLSSLQRRNGPNLIGYYGLLQAISDGLKLIFKGFTLPEGSDRFLFVLGPLISFSMGFGLWGLFPFGFNSLVVSEVGLILVLALSSLSIHGVLLGGYSSNSKYAYYGSVRSSAQMISYEVSLAFIIGGIVLLEGGSFSLHYFSFEGNYWVFLGGFPLFILWLVSILAETNRHPFDLPEAESELVSGYNVEYSGGSFALYFLGEYSSILFMSYLTALLFGNKSFILFILVVLFFIWSRAAWPRVRYDQLMFFGWLGILPVSLGILILIMGLIV